LCFYHLACRDTLASITELIASGFFDQFLAKPLSKDHQLTAMVLEPFDISITERWVRIVEQQGIEEPNRPLS
jgi:ABC-type uncharacterized transport system permease subunit